LHGDPKVKVTRRSVCLPQPVALTLGSVSATIAVQGYTRAKRRADACDHCAKERPQPRDAHPTEHPFPAQSDPQVAFARSFNRRHHRRQRAPATGYRGGTDGSAAILCFAQSAAIATNFAKLPWRSSSYTAAAGAIVLLATVMQRHAETLAADVD
jgi:hypothetical protein